MASVSGEESTESSVNGSLAGGRGIVCPFCQRKSADLKNLNNHFRRVHKNRSMIGVPVPAGVKVCSCGTWCKNADGLMKHHNQQRFHGRTCPSQPSVTPTPVVLTPVEETEEIPSAEVEQPEVQPEVQELVDLVARLGVFGLFRVHPAWSEHILQISAKLVQVFDDEIDGVVSQAAFLLLPAVVKALSRTQGATSWLKTTAAAMAPETVIIRTARILRDDVEETRRRPREGGFGINIRRRSAELYREGRLNALNRMIAEVSEGERPRHPSGVQHREILGSLYPDVAEENRWSAPAAAAQPSGISITADMVREVLEGLPRDKAKGVSAWSYYAIRYIFLQNGNGVEALRKIFVLMSQGRLSRELWVVSRSVLIPKRGSTKYRPLAIGESFYRILGKLISRILQAECENHLAPIQLGCGVSGGADKVGRIAQLSLGESRLTQVVSLDIANAFGHITRASIFSSLTGPFAPLQTVFGWAYGGPINLFNSKGERVHAAVEGVMQGDPLSSMFFCLGFQPVLQKIQTSMALMHTLPSARSKNGYYGQVLAYMDDVTMLVRNDLVDDVLQMAEETLSAEGLNLNTDKTVIVLGGEPYRGPRTTCGAAKIVGTPIGHDAGERREILEKTKERLVRELGALREADVGLHVKFNLLRTCINPVPGFLTRVCEPTRDFLDFACDVDLRVDEFLFFILGTPMALREKARFRYLRELPQRLGGLGIGRHSGWFGEKACLLSRHLTRRHIWTYFPESRGLDECMGRWRTLRLDRIMDELREKDATAGSWWDRDCNWADDEEDDSPVAKILRRREIELLEKEYEKELREAMRSLYYEGRKALLAKLEDEGRTDWQAWLLSSEFRGSGRYLIGEGDHLKGEFQITRDDEYRTALRLRCMVDPRLPATAGPCPLCRRIVAPSDLAFHLLNCQHASWFFTQRHNAVREQVMCFLTRLELNPEREVTVGPGLVADIVYRPAGATKPVLIDVTVSNPAAPFYAQNLPHEHQDAVAFRREEEKAARYQAVSEQYHILPFVVEATGRLGPKARTWMRELTEDQRYLRTKTRERIGAKIIQFVAIQILMLGKSITIDSLGVGNNNSGSNTANALTPLGIAI